MWYQIHQLQFSITVIHGFLRFFFNLHLFQAYFNKKGGGWTFGSSNTHFYSVASVASKVNTVWLSVDYRLGPEHKFQTQMEDCRSVLEWVAKNKTQFSSESAKIGVSGKSNDSILVLHF